MRLSSLAARVTIIPVATEMSSAGICEQRPSPTLGVGVENSVEITAAAHHTDDNAADEVNEGGDDGHDGVALYELRSTVHGAVEVSLALDIASALLRLFLVDYSGVEVGVYRHLLTGHSVQREAGCNLGYSLGTLGNYDEVD